MNLVTNIIEPDELILVWQRSEREATDQFTKTGRRYAVGKIQRKDDNYVFRYLRGTEDFILAQKEGFEGYPAFLISSETFETNVIEVFSRRLPNRSRTDFADYLKYFRINPTAQLSDFALLGYTGGELPHDGFGFIHPYKSSNFPVEFVIGMAGGRHYLDKVSNLKVGDPVKFVPEPENPNDRNAVMIQREGHTIGYVKKVQADTFAAWLSQREVTGQIERVNGTDSRPNVLIYGKVN